MSKKEIKLWNKYLDYLETLNAPIRKMNKKWLDEWQKEEKEEHKRYLLQMKEYDKKFQVYYDALDKYFNLPWYKQLFTVEPEFPWGVHMPYLHFGGMLMTWPERQPNYEEFLTKVAKGEIK